MYPLQDFPSCILHVQRTDGKGKYLHQEMCIRDSDIDNAITLSLPYLSIAIPRQVVESTPPLNKTNAFIEILLL